MNNKALFPLVGCMLAVVLVPFHSTPAHAIVDCVSASSDPDGDGWGWENGESCLVVPVGQPAPEPGTDPDPIPPSTGAPVCLLAGSDPDGDGWGWENDSSCLVQAVEPEPGPNGGVVPGQSLQTATPITIDSDVSGTFSTSAGSHWYQFTIDHHRPLAVTFTGVASEYYVELHVQYADGVSVSDVSLDGFFRPVHDQLCIPPDTYYVQVRSYGEPEDDVDYTFTVESSPFTCEFPDFASSNNGRFVDLIPEGYLLVEDYSSLAAYSHDGVVRWRLPLEGTVGFSILSKVTADTIYVATEGTLHAIDFEGNLQWSYSIGDDDFFSNISALEVSEDTVYFAESATLYALNLNGTPKWINNLINAQSVSELRLGDNGALYVVNGSDTLSVFNIP